MAWMISGNGGSFDVALSPTRRIGKGDCGGVKGAMDVGETDHNSERSKRVRLD